MYRFGINNENEITISLFGHDLMLGDNGVNERLYIFLESIIKKQSVKFLIGTIGFFNEIALRVCISLKEKYGDRVKIDLVFVSSKMLLREVEEKNHDRYKNIQLADYGINKIYFSKYILRSNEKMIDYSDMVIVYYSRIIPYSVTKRVITYAESQNKNIINIFNQTNYSIF